MMFCQRFPAKAFLIIAALVTLGASRSSAEEHKDESTEMLQLEKAPVSLSQAIATAERHVGGKASHAEFSKSKDQWVYEIEVVKGQKGTDVKVDSKSGKILSAIEDKPDQDSESRDEED